MFFWHADYYFIEFLLENARSIAPNHNLEVKAFIQQFCCVIWEIRCVTGKHLRTIIWIAQFKLPFLMLICVHTGQNTVTTCRMIRNSNDHSNFALCSRVKTLYVCYDMWLWSCGWTSQWHNGGWKLDAAPPSPISWFLVHELHWASKLKRNLSLL